MKSYPGAPNALFNTVLSFYSYYHLAEGGRERTSGAKSDLEYTVKNNPITRIMTDGKRTATIPESIGDYNRARGTIVINATRSFRHHVAIFLNIFAMYTPVASITLRSLGRPTRKGREAERGHTFINSTSVSLITP